MVGTISKPGHFVECVTEFHKPVQGRYRAGDRGLEDAAQDFRQVVEARHQVMGTAELLQNPLQGRREAQGRREVIE